MGKTAVLILGGCGFIGRNLVSFLLSEDVVSTIRVVDKVPPQIAWLNSDCQKAFDNPLVEFRSANLINSDSCAASFLRENNASWDLVVNCAGETKPGQNDAVYNDGIVQLSLNCAKEAARNNAGYYIELSSGCMYSSEKAKHKEDDPVEPWGFVAEWKRQVEKQLSTLDNLNYSVFRLATVYGLGDRNGLTARILVAAIYKRLNETMHLLWTDNLGVETVHVEDVCRAIWFCYSKCRHQCITGQIYNIVDEAASTQGSITSILVELFAGLKVSYYGNLVSKAIDRAEAADEANDKHLATWAEACRRDAVENTPLTPHMHPDALLPKHSRLDGTKLADLGFRVAVPKPSIDHFQRIIEDFIAMGVFPQSLHPKLMI